MYELSAVCGDTVKYPSLHFNIRPSPDRVRETLFNWLQGDIAGRRCLEPFAGSGILSFKRSPRGSAGDAVRDSARSCFIPQGRSRQIRRVSTCLRYSPGGWVCVIEAPPPLTDLVFLDPPFAEARFDELFEALSEEERYPAHLLVYVESAAPLPNRALPHSASSRLNKNKPVE